MHFYIRLIKNIARLSLQRQLIYKTDFFFYGASVISFAITQIVFLFFLFSVNKDAPIAGFSKSEMLFVYLISQWVNAFFFALGFDNLKQLGQQITRGELDFYFLLPGNISFHLLFQKVSFRNTVSMIFINLIATAWFAPNLHIQLSFTEWWIVLWICLSSTWLFQMIYLIAASCLFFVREMWGPWNFLNSVGDISRYPQAIYPGAVQLFFMTIVPFFVVINPTYTILHHQYTVSTFLWSVFFILVYSAMSIFIWKKAINRYESGN